VAGRRHRVPALLLSGVLAALVTPTLCARVGQAPGSPSAADLAGRLQRHYDGIRDFSAAFTHTYEGGVLRKKTTERGDVIIKKPGKMRWTYTSPEEKVFVSDGRKIYAWIPADNQVTVSSMPEGEQASTPMLFLLGRGSLTRDFIVTFADPVPGAPADSSALLLTPRGKAPEYDTLTVVVDRNSLALKMLVANDAQSGRSSFTFSNLKENVGLPDSRFTFNIPRGADVVSQS
jgi:outer membrane lipoprotein carrier protein